MKTIAAWVGMVVSAMGQTAQAADAQHPVVLELFTSQGCSSCPPADALAAEYAESPGVLVLSYHVDYWDSLGWKDPYSSAANTARQYQYASFFGTRRVYTPQAVVQGARDVVGSDERALKRAIDGATTNGFVPVTVALSGGGVDITIPKMPSGNANVLLVGYTKHSSNNVPNGENSGRQLSHRNSVTSVTALGSWGGEPIHVTRTKPAGDGVAVLLQVRDSGAIIGAGWL